MKSMLLALIFSALVVSMYGQRYELRVVDKGDRAHVQMRNVQDQALKTNENLVTDIVFGVKWRDTGIEGLDIVPGSYRMVASGGVKEHLGYKFQAYGAMQTPYTMPTDWTKGKWVDIVVLKVRGSKQMRPGGSRFTLAETGYDLTTDPNVGIDLVDETPKIVGYQVTDAVLPTYATQTVHLEARKYGPRNGHLTWTVEEPEVINGYLVERRIGDNAWTELAHIPSEGQFVHVYVDEDAYDGVNREQEITYRVRILAGTGEEKLSEERILDFNAQKMIVQIYPNPASEKVGVDMTPTATEGTLYLEVYGRDGRLVYRNEIERNSVKEEIDLAKSNIESGSYTIHLVEGDKILDAHPLHVMR